MNVLLKNIAVAADLIQSVRLQQMTFSDNEICDCVNCLGGQAANVVMNRTFGITL